MFNVCFSSAFIIVQPITTPKFIFVLGFSPLQKIFNWPTFSKSRFWHLLINYLNYSHASQSCSSTSWLKVEMLDLTPVYLKGGKDQFKNFSSTTFQLVKLWFRWDCSQDLAFLARENRMNRR